MPDDLERVLQLVAEGQLTAEQAAPILDALAATDQAAAEVERAEAIAEGAAAMASDARTGSGRATSIRVEVTDKGRKVVNLRIPITLGRLALDRIPGIAGNHADLVRQALAEGRVGPVLVLDDDGDGVRIAIE